jgi:para-nitrobenzyl esterase
VTGPVVVTASGRVEGTSHDGVERFLGIPYAAPPVGELRFRAPRAPLEHDGVLRADSMPPHAPQPPSPLEGFLGEGVAPTVSEADCLGLNVWTPGADGSARPVMVFVHGGAFVWGSSASPMYDGTRLAADNDVVVVSFNYRLGVVGFTSCAAVGGPDFAGSGLAGVLDAVAALQWVARNIAAFGGDPGNVTVFGESAGAMSVGTLLALPGAKGLFHKAILQSGAASSVMTAAQGEAVFEELCEVLGTPLDVAALQALPLERLVDAQVVLTERHARRGLLFGPCVDGDVLPRAPLDAVGGGSAADVPLLVGTNLDEWRLFSTFDPEFAQRDDAEVEAAIADAFGGDVGVATATYKKRVGDVPLSRVLECVMTDATFRIPAIRLAEAQHRAGGDAWMYLLTRPTSAFGGVLGCCHGLELPLVFNTLDAASSRLFYGDDPPRDLARKVDATWAAFARHGDPGHGTLGAWPCYDTARRATMLLDDAPGVQDDPLSEERTLWD